MRFLPVVWLLVRFLPVVRLLVRFLPVVWLLAALSVFGFVSEQGFNDAKQQEKHYCEMVNAKYWPAYRHDIDCEENNER